MKKLFVSVPMKDRTEANIKASIQKMKRIAEAYEGEELELIDSYITEESPEGVNLPVWYLSKSVELLATADVFIGCDEAWYFHGCQIEREIADFYGIKRYSTRMDYVMDDYAEIMEAQRNSCATTCN